MKAIEGRRVGRGVSVQFAFGTHMLQVVEASVEAQIQGGIMFGISGVGRDHP